MAINYHHQLYDTVYSEKSKENF